ncbi:MAG TPA: DUF1080 domain-containing protein [Gemmatales bacterium]|nr:DUF1080 domain-containing protein [Gemmatales bacterium]
MKYALSLCLMGLVTLITLADEPVTKAFIDGIGQGWVTLGEKDFVNVNCDPDTFVWKKDGSLYCKGTPVGVARSQKQYTNFELVLYWKHLKSAGNSGVFVWSPEKPLFALKRNQLPHGIEVQVLDHGYTEQYEKSLGKKATWFTTNGDVFPVGSSKMKPFTPISPDGSRSFPRKNLSRGINEWNHYYVRAINGEIRLWVNGEEVSGGNQIEPRMGYLCLESEGSPIEFKEIRLRELP